MDIKELRVICDEVKILMKTIEIIEEANAKRYWIAVKTPNDESYLSDAQINSILEIAKIRIAEIEKMHEERYKKFLSNLKENIVFKRGEKTMWICRVCGHIHIGSEPPKACPACMHPQAYYEIYNENF